MDEDRYLRIAVEPMDALPEVLSRVRGHAGRPVFLAIPAASPLFLTASEFRALRETVRSANANLVVVSDDRQRQDFARLFNLVPAEDEAAAIAWIGEQAAPRPPVKPAIDPALGPPRTAGSGGWAPRVEPPKPAIEPTPEPPPAAPATPEPISTALVPVVEPTPMPVPVEHRKRRKWPWLVSLLVLLLLLAGAAAWLPQATVTLTRERTPLTSQVPVIVTEPGETLANPGDAVVISGERQSMNVTVAAMVPATGERATPDQPAHGGIALANTTSASIILPAGAEFTSDGGLVFTLDSEVTVPAAAGDRSGIADGAVTAVEGGTAGNLAQGALSGQHESGVYFSNRNGALAGGTDRIVTVVSEADMETARTELETRLYEALSNALNMGLETEGIVVVPGSITHPDLVLVPEYQVGEETEQLHVEATTDVSGLTFDSAVAHTAILDAAAPSAQVAEGEFIELDSVEITYAADPTGAANAFIADVIVWQVTELDAATIDGLADELARTTVDDAMAKASAIDGVASVSIKIKPDWLPSAVRERMPIVPQRIDEVEE